MRACSTVLVCAAATAFGMSMAVAGADSRCVPWVALDGDLGVIGDVAPILERRGVEAGPPGVAVVARNCAAVTATLNRVVNRSQLALSVARVEAQSAQQETPRPQRRS